MSRAGVRVRATAAPAAPEARATQRQPTARPALGSRATQQLLTGAVAAPPGLVQRLFGLFEDDAPKPEEPLSRLELDQAEQHLIPELTANRELWRTYVDHPQYARIMRLHSRIRHAYAGDPDFEHWIRDPKWRTAGAGPQPPPPAVERTVDIRVDAAARRVVVSVDGVDVAETPLPGRDGRLNLQATAQGNRVAIVADVPVRVLVPASFGLQVAVAGGGGEGGGTVPVRGVETPGGLPAERGDDWTAAWNRLTPAERARASYEARVPPRERRGVQPRWYYTKEMAEIDAPPLFVELVPYGRAVWMTGDLIAGETLSGIPLDRGRQAKAVLGEVGKETLLNVAGEGLGKGMAAIAGGGEELARGLRAGERAAVREGEELAGREARTLTAMSPAEREATDELLAAERKRLALGKEADFGDVAKELEKVPVDNPALSARGRNVYAPFDPVPPALSGDAAEAVELLSGKLPANVPADRVLDAPWVGRVYRKGGDLSSRGTSMGWERLESEFWSGFERNWPDDYKLITKDKRVTKALAQKWGWPDETVGDKLIHHHIDNGRFVVAIPETWHRELSGLIHATPTILP